MLSEKDLYLTPQRTNRDEENARQAANRMIREGFIFRNHDGTYKNHDQKLWYILEELRHYVRVREGWIEDNEQCLREGVDSNGSSLTDKVRLEFINSNQTFRSAIGVFEEAIEKVETFL